MAYKYVWQRGRRYYLWGTYSSWREAYEEARLYCKKNRKNKYFIQKVEVGFWIPEEKYRLYMSHVFKMW